MNIDIDEFKIIENIMEKYLRDSKGTLKAIQVELIKYNKNIIQFEPFIPILIFFTLVEVIQTIGMGLVSPLQYQSIGLSQFKIIANILYPDLHLREANLAPYLIIGFFLLNLSHFLISILSYKKYKNSNHSRLNLVINYGYISISTFITGPVFLTSVTTIICNKNQPVYRSSLISEECYSDFHLFLVFLSILSFLYCLLVMLYMAIFFFDPKPFYFNYFSSRNGLYFIGKLIIKLAPAIFIVADPKLNYNVLYIVMLAGLQLCYIGLFRFILPTQKSHEIINIIQFRGEMLVLFILMLNILMFFTYEEDPSNLIFVSSIFFGLFIGHHACKYKGLKKRKIIEAYLDRVIDSDHKEDYEILISGLIKNNENIEKIDDEQFIVYDFIIIHRNECKQSECFCKCEIVDCEGKSIPQTKSIGYNLIKCMIKQLSQEIKSNFSLELLSHAIDFYTLETKYRTIFQLTTKITAKIELSELVFVIHLLFELSKPNFRMKPMVAILTTSESEQSNMQWNYEKSTFHRYKLFSEREQIFQNMCIKIASMSQNYWDQIIHQDCQVNNILSIANQISNAKKQISSYFQDQLLPLMPNNKSILVTYISLMRVFKESISSYVDVLDHYELLEQRNKEILIDVGIDGVKLEENLKTVTLCAVDIEGEFRFNKISRNILDQLHLKRESVLNQQINVLVPKSMAKMHQSKILSYLERPDEKIVPKKNKVFIKDGRGSFIKINYLAKLTPSFFSGIQFTCCIQKIPPVPNEYYLMYYFSLICSRDIVNQTGTLFQIDKQLQNQLLGEQQGSLKRQQIYLGQILPEWCCYGEDFMPSGDSNDSAIRTIELEQTIPISAEGQVKILKVELFNSFDNAISAYDVTLQDKSGYTKKKSFIEFQQKKLQNLAEPIQQINNSTFNIQKINVSLIVIFFLIVSMVLSSSLITYQIHQLNHQNKHLNYYISAITKSISTIPVYLIFNEQSTAKAQISSTTENLKQINKYEIPQISPNTINVHLNLLKDQGQQQSGSYALIDGIFLYLSKSIEFLQKNIHERQRESEQFYKNNMYALFQGLMEYYGKSEKFIEIGQRYLIGVLISDILKITGVIFLHVAVYIWLKNLGKNLQETISLYENELTTNILKDRREACSSFIKKINGNQLDQMKLMKQNKTMDIETCDLQNWLSEKKYLGDNPTENQQNSAKIDEDQLLNNKKNKIAFQSQSIAKSYMKRLFLLLVFFLGVQAIFFIQSGHIKNQQFLQRNQEKYLMKLLGSIDQLMYMIGVEADQKQQILESLIKTEEELQKGIQDFDIEVKTQLTHTIQIMTQYRGGFEQQDSKKLFNSLIESYQAISKILEDITINDEKIMQFKEKNQQLLALELIASILGTITLFMLIIRSSKQISNGLIAMMNLIKFVVHSDKKSP